MHYTLHQLKILVEVAAHSSITKAADAMFLSQPAVSIQLKKLQNQFDQPLTEIVSKQLYLTPFGEQVKEAALEILNLAENIENLNLANKGQMIGKIIISSVSTGKYVLPLFLRDFFKDHPGIELLLDVTNKERVVEHLSQNDVDFALVSIPPDRIAHERLSLMSNKLYLVAHPDIATKQESLEKLLEDTPLIYREQGSGTRQAMEQFLLQKNISSRKKLELTSNEAVKQAVIAGLGVSIMPLIGIKNELTLGQLKIIPIRGLPIETEWMLIWPKGKKHGPAGLEFMKYCKTDTERIKNQYFDWYEQY